MRITVNSSRSHCGCLHFSTGATILDFAGTMERWQRAVTSKDRFIQTYLRNAVGNSDQNYTNYFLKFLSEKSKTIKFLLRIFLLFRIHNFWLFINQ